MRYSHAFNSLVLLDLLKLAPHVLYDVMSDGRSVLAVGCVVCCHLLVQLNVYFGEHGLRQPRLSGQLGACLVHGTCLRH